MPTAVKTIVCRVCGVRKSYKRFVCCNGSYTRKRTCLTCHNAQTRLWRSENLALARKIEQKTHRRRRYAQIGISEEGYKELLKRQGGRCAICRSRPRGTRLSVDHDHKTGEIRGLLCKNCNQGLGHFRDDPVRLKEAVKYLQTAQVTFS